MKKVLFINALLASVILCLTMPCFGQGTLPPIPMPTPSAAFSSQLLAKAEIDECFNGIGAPYVPGPDCAPGEIPKANHSYAWGIAKVGDIIWIGTASNMLCLMRANAEMVLEEEADPFQGDLWACEYAEGKYPDTHITAEVPPIYGDFRPPKVYTYNLTTRVLTEKTAEITDPQVHLLLENTFGMRSAVSFGNLVFMAGPVGVGPGVNVFVFNAVTGQLVGARSLPQYSNIRRWLVMGNALYTAVQATGGGGKVLRWSGNEANPFAFMEVGAMDCGGSEIAAHNGRIYVGTWPDKISGTAMPGIWMSPAVPSGGLSADHVDGWNKVWQTDNYEPDPIIAKLYGVGAMASYGGALHWGTMHVHGNVFPVVVKQYGIGLAGYASAFFNAWRSISIYRAANFDSAGSTELLYGDSRLPVYYPSVLGGYWVYCNNKMGGVSGRYGSSGFGNIFNNYTWIMAAYKGQLFVGTMDNSYLWLDWDNLVSGWLDGEFFDIPWRWTPREDEYGADLWRFPSASRAALRVTNDGFGNYTNYGFRTVVVDDATGMYLGTANPANIAQDNGGNPIGGWELIRVTQQ